MAAGESKPSLVEEDGAHTWLFRGCERGRVAPDHAAAAKVSEDGNTSQDAFARSDQCDALNGAVRVAHAAQWFSARSEGLSLVPVTDAAHAFSQYP